MAKFNIFKLLKYGGAAMQVAEEVYSAIEDGRLTAEEGLSILRAALVGADIKGLDVSLIQIHGRDDGGFEVVFPGEAIKDWTLDIDI